MSKREKGSPPTLIAEKNSHPLEQKFWFPNDNSRIFTGKILDEEKLEIYLMTLEDSEYITRVLKDRDSFVIHGEIPSEKKITVIASLSGKSSETDFIANRYNEIFVFDLRYVFYNEYFSSTDIKFNAIIIDFTNIDRWITHSDIIFGKDNNIRKEVILDINDDFLLKFFYEGQFPSDEKGDSDRTRKNVYVRIDSKSGQRSIEELLETKNIIQDFLNFVLTLDSVLSKSIYGINGGSDGEKITEIKYKSISTGGMSKCNVISPVLFHSLEYGEERLEQIIRHWFEFRKSYLTIYNYYVDSIYQAAEAIELSYFKLAVFLEGYHRELLENKGESKMRKLKNSHFDLIERMLQETEADKEDIKIVKFVVGKNKMLTFAQRLREIFDYYYEIISIRGPVLSFFDNNKLHKWIENTSYDRNTKDKLLKVMDLKIDADSEKIQEKRRDKYANIMDILKNEGHGITYAILSFVKFVLIEKFAGQFAGYRNVIGHVLDKNYQVIGTNKWFYAFKTLQLTGQICVLNLLGFSYQEICKTYFIEDMDEETRLKIMIETNIGF